MASAMTPIDRFRTALVHRQPDRPPIQAWMTQDIRGRLERYFGASVGDSVEDILGVDLRYVTPPAVEVGEE